MDSQDSASSAADCAPRSGAAGPAPSISRPHSEPDDASEVEVWSTEGDDRLLRNLPPLQLRVITCLVGGENVTEASRYTGVGRSTIYHWLNNDANFRAELDAQRRELYELAEAKLVSVADEALETVVAHMERGSLQAALELLKGIGLLKGRRPNLAGPVAESATAKES